MTQPPLPSEMLVNLARQCGSTWNQMAADAFRGDTSFETGNAIYRFRHGVFMSRSTKATGALEAPRGLQGLRLIGFLVYDNGLWSLSAQWKKGALAVMWESGGTKASSFTVTSATLAFSTAPPPRRHTAPMPASMTRIFSTTPSMGVGAPE